MREPQTPGQSYRTLVEHFSALLGRTAGERSQREDLVVMPNGDREPGWVLHERTVMHDEVNRLRAEAGRGDRPILDILGAERAASGHIDYAAKFALGCAELVVRD